MKQKPGQKQVCLHEIFGLIKYLMTIFCENLSIQNRIRQIDPDTDPYPQPLYLLTPAFSVAEPVHFWLAPGFFFGLVKKYALKKLKKIFKKKQQYILQ